MKTITLEVRPNTLYKPAVGSNAIIPDINADHKMLDRWFVLGDKTLWDKAMLFCCCQFYFFRIVVVRDSYTVPLDMRGTIIGINKVPDVPEESTYEILFDKEFLSGNNLRYQSYDLLYFFKKLNKLKKLLSE